MQNNFQQIDYFCMSIFVIILPLIILHI